MEELKERSTECVADICHSCQRQVYRCFSEQPLLAGPMLCPFCNEEISGRPCAIMLEAKLDDITAARAKRAAFTGALREACAGCGTEIGTFADRVKLPNCEHVWHRDCFADHWRRALADKYEIEPVTVFEEAPFDFNCPVCRAEVSFQFITYVVPWSQLGALVCDTIFKDCEPKPEQLAKTKKKEITMAGCGHKLDSRDVRGMVYEDLKGSLHSHLPIARGSYEQRCKLCGREGGCQLRKVVSPAELRTLGRMVCCICRRVMPFFARVSCEHYICRICYYKAPEPKASCVFCAKGRISKR